MEYKQITYHDIRENPEVTALMERGNDMLGVLGYTEHSKKHACKVARGASDILKALGHDKRVCELARIAGYMHDIGNCVNRADHAHSGALLAFQILRGLDMPPDEVACVVSAIGQHDEKTGTAVDPVSAAVILADKSDVRRNRVRNRIKATFDKHDRVNYAAVSAALEVLPEKKDRPARHRAGRGHLFHFGLFRDLFAAHADVQARRRGAGPQIPHERERAQDVLKAKANRSAADSFCGALSLASAVRCTARIPCAPRRAPGCAARSRGRPRGRAGARRAGRGPRSACSRCIWPCPLC